MQLANQSLGAIGRWLARYLSTESEKHPSYAPNDIELLLRLLLPGDVLLVDSRTRVSTAIKYLTQSTWSHAALFVGDVLGGPQDSRAIVEANLGEGCVAVPIDKYRDYSLRICRPYGLTPEDRINVAQHAIARIGINYDLRNVVDLARYLLPTPPVPTRFRRQMIALGSGDPTQAICSTLIAEAFHSVGYPILPRVETIMTQDCTDCPITRAEILHIRHHSLFTPRDFDLSPYFHVVKPALASGFNYKTCVLSTGQPGQASLPLIAPTVV
jgi:Permuted papain-like amidase enzyme, YaeF/YiiX, C92 family